MSPSIQEELTQLFDRAFSIDELGELRQDRRLRRFRYEKVEEVVERLNRFPAHWF